MGMIVCDEYGLEAAHWMDLGRHVSEEQLRQTLVTEYRQRLSFPFGDAEMVQVILPNVLIIFGDLVIRQQRIRMRAIDMPDTIELHFSLAGNSRVTNKVSGNTHVFIPHQHNMMYTPEFDGEVDFDHQARKGYKFFEIHISRPYFLEVAKDSCEVLSRFADQVSAGMPAELSPRSLPISIAMQACVNEIMDCPFQGGLKLLFLQAKCLELLALQAQAFDSLASAPASPVLRSEYEKECILQARDYLVEHLDTPPSLSELSRIAGLNTYKLKNGFKEVFATTVYGYLNDVKLTRAREQLLAGTSIKDIALELGYGSVQHFSKAYRKKFGLPPGRSRR